MLPPVCYECETKKAANSYILHIKWKGHWHTVGPPVDNFTLLFNHFTPFWWGCRMFCVIYLDGCFVNEIFFFCSSCLKGVSLFLNLGLRMEDFFFNCAVQTWPGMHFVKSATSIFLLITGVYLTLFAIERLINTGGMHGLYKCRVQRN